MNHGDFRYCIVFHEQEVVGRTVWKKHKFNMRVFYVIPQRGTKITATAIIAVTEKEWEGRPQSLIV
jgi:hypothetical protein